MAVDGRVVRGRWRHKEVGHLASLAIGLSGQELPDEEGTTVEHLAGSEVDGEAEPIVVKASKVGGKGGRRTEWSRQKGSGKEVKWKMGSCSCPATCGDKAARPCGAAVTGGNRCRRPHSGEHDHHLVTDCLADEHGGGDSARW
jgi:hypothetical protein